MIRDLEATIGFVLRLVRDSQVANGVDRLIDFSPSPHLMTMTFGRKPERSTSAPMQGRWRSNWRPSSFQGSARNSQACISAWMA